MRSVRDMEAEAARLLALSPEERKAEGAALLLHRQELGLEPVASVGASHAFLQRIKGDEPAILSEDENHRLWLSRHKPDLLLDGAYGRMLFVMLNPSTADATADDMTITKCLGFAKPFQATRIGVVNLFTRRSTDPLELLRSTDLNHRDADAALEAGMLWLREGPGGTAARCVFAYGMPPWGGAKLDGDGLKSALLRDQAERVALAWFLADAWGFPPFALGVTDEGWPRHPSRLAYGDHMRPVPPAHFERLGIVDYVATGKRA